MDRSEHLRRLIAEYRERLRQGVDMTMVKYILDAIKDAERELTEREARLPPK
jgi:hypothetical protein